MNEPWRGLEKWITAERFEKPVTEWPISPASMNTDADRRTDTPETAKLRRDFEAWVTSLGFGVSLDRHSHAPEMVPFQGAYVEGDVEFAWKAWQESARAIGDRGTHAS